MNSTEAETKSVSSTSKVFRDQFSKALAHILIPPLLAAFFLLQEYFSYSYLQGTPFALRATAIYGLVVFYAWAALLPLNLRLVRNVRARKRELWPGLALLFLAGVPIGLVHRAITAVVVVRINMPEAFADGVPSWLFRKILAGGFSSLIQCWLILGGCIALELYCEYRDQTVLRARLETQLAQAQLHTLTMQLQPHFLFNTLHAISSLMSEDVPSSRRMLSRLSDLLRQTLENVSTQEVTLKRELEFVRGYLEIEQARFVDRLHVRYEAASDVLDAMVPKLILQPLAENAIRHGILPRVDGGCLTIRAQREGMLLMLEVADDGVGVDATAEGSMKEGVGLSNVRQRLHHLYGPSHNLQIHTGPGRGFVASLTVPFRVERDVHP